MEPKLAHELHSDIWRSDDISINSYCKNSNQIEIITPDGLNIKCNKKLEESIEPKSSAKSVNYFLSAQSDSTFSSIKIHPQIVKDLKRCGFIRPSPVQASAIPLGRIGIDLIAQSKSGTGKTIVFVVCALEMILSDQTLEKSPRIIIVAPTREIAVQISDIINSLTFEWKNFSCFKAIGGTKVSENISELPESQIVVGTPGRICCLLEMDFLKPQSVRMLVLDECDKLMDENFRKQIDKLYNYLPSNKQMIVTSATMSDEMTLFLAKYMRTPALVRLNADNPALNGVMQLYHQTVGHQLDYLNFESKMDPLLEILRKIHFSQCVIFSNYQTRAKYLYDRLIRSNWTALWISGDQKQKERLEAINAFRRHRCRILISTDLTSRGIDIDTVNLVINLDVPIDSETYLHRIGRAGRFGSAGIAITLVGNAGSDMKRFQSIVSQYRLKVQELTFPISINLWTTFYQDRLDCNGSKLEKILKGEIQLKQNEQLMAVVSRFNDKFELLSSNEDDEDGMGQLREENSNSFVKKHFLSDLLDDRIENYCFDDLNELSENDHIEKVEPVRKLSNQNVLTVSRESVDLLKDQLEVDDISEETNQSISHDDSRIQLDHELLLQQQLSKNRLFVQTFLRPQMFNTRSPFMHLDRSKLSICKYLLNGRNQDSSVLP